MAAIRHGREQLPGDVAAQQRQMARSGRVYDGVRWEYSKSRQVQIALAAKRGGGWRVWAVYAGTHDMAERGHDFAATENGWHNARAFANRLWAER